MGKMRWLPQSSNLQRATWLHIHKLNLPVQRSLAKEYVCMTPIPTKRQNIDRRWKALLSTNFWRGLTVPNLPGGHTYCNHTQQPWAQKLKKVCGRGKKQDTPCSEKWGRHERLYNWWACQHSHWLDSYKSQAHKGKAEENRTRLWKLEKRNRKGKKNRAKKKGGSWVDKTFRE